MAVVVSQHPKHLVSSQNPGVQVCGPSLALCGLMLQSLKLPYSWGWGRLLNPEIAGNSRRNGVGGGGHLGVEESRKVLEM